MRRMIVVVFILILVAIISFCFILLKNEPKNLMPYTSFNISRITQKKEIDVAEKLLFSIIGTIGDLTIGRNQLYFSDTNNNRLLVLNNNDFNGELSFKFVFGREGEKLGEFKGPSGLALARNRIYIIDNGNSRIQVLKINPDGSLIPESSFGMEGKEGGKFKNPWGLAIRGNHLYICDTGNSRIQVLKINPDGSLSFDFAFGKQGKQVGEFMHPFSLSFKGNFLFIADSGNSRIQAFKISLNGKPSFKFSYNVTKRISEHFELMGGQLTSLAIKGNYLYINDSTDNRIQVLRIVY